MIRQFWHILKQHSAHVAALANRAFRAARAVTVRLAARSVRLASGTLRTARRLQPTRNQVAAGVLLGAGAFGQSMMEALPVGADVASLTKSIQDRPGPPPPPDQKSVHIEGRVAILMQISMLEEAISRLQAVESYTAEFRKHERIGGEMQGSQLLELKVRHKPFGIYMKVLEADEDVGREILFPISKDDQRLAVKVMRLGGRIPPMKLGPASDLAMKESRYPITMAGILELARFAQEVRQRDLLLKDRVRASMRDDRDFEGRPTYTFMVEYQSESDSPDYRKCIIQVDKETMLPVLVRNYTWPGKVAAVDHNRLDETTLLETYSFTKINLKASLEEDDFSMANRNYKFQ